MRCNKKWLISVLLMGMFSLAFANPVTSNKTVLKTKKEKLSYTIGADLGANFKQQGIDIDPNILLKGIEDSLMGRPQLLTKKEMTITLREFQQDLMKKRANRFQQLADKNKAEGEVFLAKNKAKDGVKVLDNGLQYKIIRAGKGISPTVNDTVTVEYKGTLLNGKVFDSTEKKGKPVSFRVNQVIPGWTQALIRMKEGAIWKVYVPSNLAYGQRGVGGPIGPNQTLIFKIHLISVQKNKKDPAKKS